jgi:hypothetical protein
MIYYLIIGKWNQIFVEINIINMFAFYIYKNYKWINQKLIDFNITWNKILRYLIIINRFNRKNLNLIK